MSARHFQQQPGLFPFFDGGRSHYAIGRQYPDRASARDRIMAAWQHSSIPQRKGASPPASIKSPLDTRQQTILSYGLNPAEQRQFNSGSDFAPPENRGRRR